MGSRAADKLKEIEEVRASLGRRLQEIEDRVPLAGYGKKAAAAFAGSSVAASALGFLVKRKFGGRKSKKKVSSKDSPMLQPVTVNVLPKGAAWIAAAGLAAFAGVKVYEAIKKNGSSGSKQQQRPAVVTQIPTSGAGS